MIVDDYMGDDFGKWEPRHYWLWGCFVVAVGAGSVVYVTYGVNYAIGVACLIFSIALFGVGFIKSLDDFI